MRRSMIRLGILSAACLAMVVCGSHLPPTMGGTYVLEAAQVPFTAHFSWDANPATDNIVDYVTTLDAGPTQTQPVTVCTAGRCVVAVVIPSFGTHTLTVAGQNINLTSTVQTGAVSSLPFSLNPDPTAPKNLAVGP